mmetsp:Transcript_24393/g.78680  ORF Transcript_24393/g.78680 Transcript_24393/m.78680 type:complete len:238 (-) Transcript_24393:679-1392(-)
MRRARPAGGITRRTQQEPGGALEAMHAVARAEGGEDVGGALGGHAQSGEDALLIPQPPVAAARFGAAGEQGGDGLPAQVLKANGVVDDPVLLGRPHVAMLVDVVLAGGLLGTAFSRRARSCALSRHHSFRRPARPIGDQRRHEGAVKVQTRGRMARPLLLLALQPVPAVADRVVCAALWQHDGDPRPLEPKLADALLNGGVLFAGPCDFGLHTPPLARRSDSRGSAGGIRLVIATRG